MRVKQQNIRSFHFIIEREEEFFSYFKKNLTILKKYFILLEGNITEEIISFLKKNRICFNSIDNCSSILHKKNSSDSEILIQKEFKENSTKKRVKIYNRTIRSGEEIFNENDIIINGRVNSGAKVVSNSNIIIFNDIDGFVECRGEYMILRNIHKGIVHFNNEIINLPKGDLLKVIYLQKELLMIKEIK